MASLLPMAMYGLEVTPGFPVIAHADIPAAFRVTMAAIDPSAEPEGDEDELARPRATLKVIRLTPGDDDDSEDEMDDEDMDEQFDDIVKFGSGESSSEEDDDEDEDEMGGPSDPAKTKKARREAADKAIREMLETHMAEDDHEMTNGVNGAGKSRKALGKMPASDSDEDDDDDDSDLDDVDGAEAQEFVLCTLDPEKHWQQTLDITFGERERVWFQVSGTHSIYLTGNYVEPTTAIGEPYDSDSDEEGDYDLSPDEDELDDSDIDSVDELDDLEDPRITELEEDEAEPPALIKAEVKKTNKRPAQDSADEDEAHAGASTLDEMIKQEAQAVNGEQKLSKKQLKKLKKNNGLAAGAPVVEKVEEKISAKKDAEQPSSNKSDKKVTFASQLEQGPTPTKSGTVDEKKDDKKDGKKDQNAKSSLGVKTIQGIKIDDRKTGDGQAAKKGDKVSMRYIGKLEKDGRQFDANKSGKPFMFKLGSGEVIKGWDIGVEGMKAGGERRLTIPAHLAYGSKRAGDIPPNSALVFDIKLLDIQKGK